MRLGYAGTSQNLAGPGRVADSVTGRHGSIEPSCPIKELLRPMTPGPSCCDQKWLGPATCNVILVRPVSYYELRILMVF
jgi:hypothetical protein